MQQEEMSVSDVWLSPKRLVQTLVERIRQCGVYSPYNEEWQSLSTMIDYALKWLKGKPESQSILDELKKIGYNPLFDVSETASIKLGWIRTSPDGKIGINIYQTATSDGNTSGLLYENCLTLFLTGRCLPLYSIMLKGLQEDVKYAISPDSRKLAILARQTLSVWSIARCEIIFRKPLSKVHDDSTILWSGNSNKIILTYYGGFRVLDIRTSEENVVQANLNKTVENIVTNEDATEFMFMKDGHIEYTMSGPFNISVLTEDMDFTKSFILRTRDGFWALIDDRYYRLEDGNLVLKGNLDPSVDVDPYRFEEILGDHMDSEFAQRDFRVRHCSVERDGPNIVFLSGTDARRTHVCTVDIESLDYEIKIIEQERTSDFIRDDSDIYELNEEYSYTIRRAGSDTTARFILISGKDEIPLGTCRNDAQAIYADGKVFIHKGTRIEIYDSKSLELIKSFNSMDAERWIISGTDRDGTVSLVRLEDMVSDIGNGTNARVKFARLKAPEFKLDVFEGSSLQINNEWNLKFRMDVKDNILFCYHRDANRLKPVTLYRYILQSGALKESFTLNSNEGLFSSKVCPLRDGRVAIISMDNLEDSKDKEPKVELYTSEPDPSSGLKRRDLTKTKIGEHLEASGISDAFALYSDGSEHIVVQFFNHSGGMICSRDTEKWIQYPLGDRFLKGRVVFHDDVFCIIKDDTGAYSRYDARLNLVESDVQFDEAPPMPPKESPYSVPLNKAIQTSCGKVIQNYGVFFILESTE